MIARDLKRSVTALILFTGLVGCGIVALATDATQSGTMQISCENFSEGSAIPAKFTCDGQNSSPALKWSGAPAATKSFALIADDPDAPMGTWVHWVLYDIPGSADGVVENASKSASLPAASKEGVNDFKQPGYGGPCPPAGKPHRYVFKLYALDTVLELKPGATKKQLEQEMTKHILAEAKLTGTYKRK
jgi:Raf kinase inhibitor-like YbhB/YbcL family protein